MAALSDVVIISACRTAVGKFQGSLSDLTATQLGAIAVKEAVERAKLNPKQVDECIMGNVVSAGVNEFIIPNYKQTWGAIRKIADAPEVVKSITLKSQEYSIG